MSILSGISPESYKDGHVPEGHVGLCSAHVCTISVGGVRDTYFPLTPPPKRENSDPAWPVDYWFKSRRWCKPSRSDGAGVSDTNLGRRTSPQRNPLLVREQSEEIICSNHKRSLNSNFTCVDGLCLFHFLNGFGRRSNSLRCRRARTGGSGCARTTWVGTDSKILPVGVNKRGRKLGEFRLEGCRQAGFGKSE